MKTAGLDLADVRAVSVSGQQHGTVYWAKGARDRLAAMATLPDEDDGPGGALGSGSTGVDNGAQGVSDRKAGLLPSIPDALSGCFAVEHSPIWADGSTEDYAGELERKIGGADRLAALTGSRAHLRQGAPQIMKVNFSPVCLVVKTSCEFLRESPVGGLALTGE